MADARAGRGPVGELLTRTNALQWVQDNQDRIREFGTGLGAPALSVLRGAGNAVVATVTVFVLSYLGVLEGPRLVDNTLALLEPTRAERIRRVGRDCAITVTGYISGNLLISAICGVLTYAVLKICGVPFSGLIALFVALADLIPMVGATLGAVVAAIAGFVHSVPVGIVVVVFFVVYQQLENHLLQPWIFSRTVKLNPLAVLVAILLAVELAGILGALLAIPIAGIIQVVVRDVWDNRHGRPKQRPTVGADRAPVGTGGRQARRRAGVNRQPLLCLDDALATVEMTKPTVHPWIRLLCPAHSFSRSATFCGFPVAVRGSWSTNSTAFGTLKRAMRVCR